VKLRETKLGLGTVQFGLPYGISNSNGQTPENEVCKTLEAAKKIGVRLIDTASAYGNAEQVLGNCGVSHFRIISKFLPVANEQMLSAQLTSSLAALRVSSVYGYMAHRPEELAKNKWQWEWLGEAKGQGLISKRGFSLNHPDELVRLLDQGYLPDIVQVPYNYFDQRFETLMMSLKKTGCEIHTRSVFLQGLFFRSPETLPAFFDAIKPELKKLHSLPDGVKGALLKFVMEKPFIDQVIIGVENAVQLNDNFASLDSTVRLPHLEMDFPAEILMPSNWPQDA
jgi:aryl-alcohol dehydrogenase-like predicted oxidoreductase